MSTSFSIRVRNAVVSLTSGMGNTSTTTRLEMVNIVDTGEFINEAEKWEDYIGQNVRIYKEDYTEDETVVFTGFDPSDINYMLVNPPLTFTPTTDHFVGVPEYNNTDADIDSVYKLQFAHWNAQAKVSAVIDASSFDVLDSSILAIDSEIYIHDPTFGLRDSFTDSKTFIITNIVGNTVTLDQDLPFTPQIGDLVEFSDFLDGGFPFSII